MASREPIDYLLEALEDDSEDEITDVSEIVTVSANNRSSHQSTPISSPNHLSKLGVKNLSSSSLKKRQKKSTNCKFCIRFKFSREQLEQHFKDSETCCLLYMRQEKVNTIDGIFLKIYKCMSCETKGNFQLKRHLDQNIRCMRFFQNRFKCQDWNEIKSYIIRVTRSSYPSRSVAKRRLDNAMISSKKKDGKTIIDGLNSFQKDTSLANWRLCVICSQFFLNSGAIEIEKEDKKYAELKLENKPELTRMSKFWICRLCNSTSTINSERKYCQSIMKNVIINGVKLLIPCENEQNNEIDLDMKTSILIPKNCLAVKKKPENYPLYMYIISDHTNKSISTHYQSRLSKFYHRKSNSETFEGIILNNESRQLSSVIPIIDDSCIRQSDSWKNKKRNSIFSCFEQFGQIAIAFNFDIKLDNIQTIATLLISAGRVVTMEYIGNKNNEFELKYYLHNHNDNIPCDETCSVNELVNLDVPLRIKCIPTYLTHVFQKQNAFIEHFVKNKSFAFTSEDYNVFIDFHQDGRARLNGILWPIQFEQFNSDLSKNSLTGEEIETENFIAYIEKYILATTNVLNISNQLGITHEEALIIHRLAIKNQIKSNGNETLFMPSFECLLTKKPEYAARENLYKADEFLEIQKELLMKVSNDEKFNLTVLEWFNLISKSCKFILLHNDSFLQVNFMEKEIIFKFEDRLSEYIEKYGFFIGLHHYCLSCNDIENKIILKRTMVLDCFTVPYNDSILKAFNDEVNIVPINGIIDWWEFEDKFQPNYANLEKSEISTLLKSHKPVPLTEFFSLSDPNKIKDVFSTPIEFVSAYMERKTILRKVTVRNDESYSFPGKGHFEVLSSNILRHHGRINGRNLLLVESILWYDVLTKKQGLEVYQLYKDKIEKIPVGNIIGIYNTALPTYIISSNNRVMKLRKIRKVLKIPNFQHGSKEFKFCKILLYYPLAPNVEIDTERIGNCNFVIQIKFHFMMEQDGVLLSQAWIRFSKDDLRRDILSDR